MQQRGDVLWALTGRRVPAQRGCSAPQPGDICSYQYEAVELHGLVPNGSALETIASAELPLGVRVWWATDGVATLTDDGTLHVLRWDATGALQGPIEVPYPRGPLAPDALPGEGPIEIVGNQLLWVNSAVDLAGSAPVFDTTLFRFDLNGDVAQPTSSFDLGPTDAGSYSLFWQNQLWLNPDYTGEAQIWDVSAATPARITLPQTFYRFLPLPEAALDGHSNQPLALAFFPGHDLKVLTLDGANVSLAEDLGASSLSPTTSQPAPAELHGNGPAPVWNIVLRGSGLPLGLDPSTVPNTEETPWLRDFVRVASDQGDTLAEATLLQPADAPPRVEIHTDTATNVLTVPDGSDRLVPVPNGVVVLANEGVSPCLPSNGCNGQSATLIIVSGMPQVVGSLPLPVPDVGRPWDPGRIMSFDWSTYDAVTGTDAGPQLLDAQHLAFVANVLLECDAQADCDALGIRPLLDAASGALWGQSSRQYIYTLQIAGAGAPRWQAIGVSSVQTTSRNPQNWPKFAAAHALGGTLAVTRLERTSPSGDLLPNYEYRFVLDRFHLGDSGKPEVSAAVTIPGYPVAFLGSDADAEYWVSAEPLPGVTGQARLHRLRITTAGAENEKQLDLSDAFGGFWPMQVDSEPRGIVLGNPQNGCGVTHLSALTLGTSSVDADLELTSELDLPSDNWQVIDSD
ncbi:MAG TPA: hypothetical protein VG963_16450, partial [Polyangiaceae bacterium]|nr:hypothetical protein [Polyangiaceae bacterium]